MRILKRTLLVLASLTPMLAAVPVKAASIVTVEATNANGWQEFVRDGGDSVISSDLGAPVGLGTSSLKQTTPLSNDKTTVYYVAPAGMQLDDLSAISYYTYRSSASTSPAYQVPSINVAIDYNGTADGGFSTLVFEPVYQTGGGAAILSDQWQMWDASGGAIWWSSNSINGLPNRDTFVSLNTIKELNPEAVVLSWGINQGGGNQGLVGGSDGLTVNDMTYNFELAPPTVVLTSKEECKNDGWKTSTEPVFKNQGDCVSYFASKGKAKGNPVTTLLSRFF